jgi:hypothetical protein
VVQRRERARLTPQAREAFRITREVGRQSFDRDIAS